MSASAISDTLTDASAMSQLRLQSATVRWRLLMGNGFASPLRKPFGRK